MKIQNQYYCLEICDTCGDLLSYSDDKQEFITLPTPRKPLLEIKMLGKTGKGIYTNSHDATFSLRQEGDTFFLTFTEICPGLSATVSLRCPEADPCCYWSCNVENQTGNPIEWIGLPTLTVPRIN